MNNSHLLKIALFSLLMTTFHSAMSMDKKKLDEKVASVLLSPPVKHITNVTAVGGGALWYFTTDNSDNFLYNVSVTAIAGLGVTLYLARQCAENFMTSKNQK